MWGWLELIDWGRVPHKMIPPATRDPIVEDKTQVLFRNPIVPNKTQLLGASIELHLRGLSLNLVLGAAVIPKNIDFLIWSVGVGGIQRIYRMLLGNTITKGGSIKGIIRKFAEPIDDQGAYFEMTDGDSRICVQTSTKVTLKLTPDSK